MNRMLALKWKGVEISARAGKIQVRMLRLAMVLLLIAGRIASLAADPEFDLYQSAAKALQDKFYERAETQFGELRAKYPNSTNAPAFVLDEARAKFFQKKYAPALELLRTNFPSAGSRADQFVYWEGEILTGQGDHAGAAARYAQLVHDYPQSPLRLEAAYLQAFAAFQEKKTR